LNNFISSPIINYTITCIFCVGQQGPAGKHGEAGARGERGFPGRYMTFMNYNKIILKIMVYLYIMFLCWKKFNLN